MQVYILCDVTPAKGDHYLTNTEFFKKMSVAATLMTEVSAWSSRTDCFCSSKVQFRACCSEWCGPFLLWERQKKL